MKECTTCGKRFYPIEGKYHQHRCIWCEEHRLKPCKDCGKTFTFNMPHDRYCIDCQSIRTKKIKLRQKEYNKKYQLNRKLGIKTSGFDKKQFKLQCENESRKKYLDIVKNRKAKIEKKLIKLQAELEICDEIKDFLEYWADDAENNIKFVLNETKD